MSIDSSLYQFLASQTAITAIVGTNPVRIAPLQMGQGQSFPRIIFWGASSNPVYAASGETALARAQFNLQCQAQTVADAESLESAVKTAVSGYQGVMGANHCSACFVLDDYDEQYPAVHGDETGVKAKTLEIEIHYT